MVTYQVINTECGCAKLSSNRLQFLNILKNQTESGVFIIAENIFSIEKMLFLMPEYLADIRRRKTVIAITNTTDIQFNSLTDDILKKLWDQVRISNVILITPCYNDNNNVHANIYFDTQ